MGTPWRRCIRCGGRALPQRAACPELCRRCHGDDLLLGLDRSLARGHGSALILRIEHGARLTLATCWVCRWQAEAGMRLVTGRAE